jgi:pimeloyl-ACP methyl ester carboxylesterase
MTSTAFGAIKTATVNGTTLAYREQGDGEPVVFVHGALSDLRTWQQQLPPIGASYRAISYSRRYARPNEDIERGTDDQMLPHVDDLAAFLQALDAAPAHLVGSSWGGFISLLTAIRYPGAVSSLVLEEPPVVPLVGLSFPPRPSEVLSLLFRRPRFALALAKEGARAFGQVEKAFRRGDDETAAQMFGSAALGKEPYRQLPEARKQQMRENVNTLRAMLLGAGFPPLSEEEVRGVSVPTLLITGEQSPAGAILLTDRLEELLPVVERVEISAASHLMHEENASAVNEAIVGFLRRHSDRPM